MNKPTFSTYMELVIATSIVGSSVVVGKLVVMRLPVFYRNLPVWPLPFCSWYPLYSLRNIH